MKKNFLFISIISIIIIFINLPFLTSQINNPCYDNVIEILEEYDKIGLEVYNKVGEKDFFFWINCNFHDYNIPTAVHESVHQLSGWIKMNMDYYFYLSDGTYPKVKYKELFYRSEIGRYIDNKADDFYYETYLTGSSGKQGLLLLLDEVNAYTFSVISGTNVAHTMSRGMNNTTRDGIATFMYYLELYLYHGRTKVPSDYNKIKFDNEYLQLIKALWENDEDSLIYSSPYKNLGINDIEILKKVYDKKNLNEIKLLFENTDYEVDFRGDIIGILLGKVEISEDFKPNFYADIDITQIDDEDNIVKNINVINLDGDEVSFIDKGSDFEIIINNIVYSYSDLQKLVYFIEYIKNETGGELEDYSTLSINDKKYTYDLILKIIKILEEMGGDNSKSVEILNQLKDLLSLD